MKNIRDVYMNEKNPDHYLYRFAELILFWHFVHSKVHTGRMYCRCVSCKWAAKELIRLFGVSRFEERLQDKKKSALFEASRLRKADLH